MSFLRSLFLEQRFFYAIGLVSISFVAGYFFDAFNAIANVLFTLFLVILLVDTLLLYSTKNGIRATRHLPKRLSNGDDNEISISITNNYSFAIEASIIDEVPFQFQLRDFVITTSLPKSSNKLLKYTLRPTQRGEFKYGNINVFVTSLLGFINRRYIFEESADLPVYPSFIQMRKFEMYAMSNRLSEIGIKKMRRVGHTMEFDQIKEYVQGDDLRSVNWKATARANQLMVNQYQDERSQQIVNVIDMGRVMKMPFDGLQLLEYAINTSLVVSNISLLKEDKAGLITFSSNKTTIVKPEKRRTHIRKIQEALYKLDASFQESDFERLVINLRQHLNQRSLILLYTNFETLAAMERQLPYLQRIAKDHLLVTIFFENTELSKLINAEASTISEVYTKAVAEKFYYEKKQIVKVLNQRGIHTILTPPKDLSVQAINKYLELKAKGSI